MSGRSSIALALLLASCGEPLGACDEGAALELVYTADGTPAFAGQAMTIASCGAGGFCHSEGIDPLERFGAPAELDFDLRPSSATDEAESSDRARLLRHRQRVVRARHAIFDSVTAGRMPPSGAAGAMYEQSVDARYDRVADDGTISGPLPSVRTDEGQEILRNWLACRAPIVERTAPRLDRDPNALGFVVAPCERTCVDPTWPEIRAQILAPSCATARCHDASEPAAELDLSGTDDEVHARILLAPALGPLCEGQAPILTASQPDASLLWLKVGGGADDDVVCGELMPLSGNRMSEQRLCALRAWIECGACPEADGGACAGCIAERRAGCGVDLTTPNRCMTAMSCASRPPSSM